MTPEQRHENPEIDRQSPLDFIVIGSGQVVDKYWFRSQTLGKLAVSSIVSLEDENYYRNRNPEYQGDYYQSTSIEQTLSHVTELARKFDNSNIAIATSSDVRLVLTSEILGQVPESRVFVEKPYGTSHEEIQELYNLISSYSNRIHLSAKYSTARADILFPHLPKDKTPKSITARIIEGTDYFNVVKDIVASRGWHQYLTDGPELDLGFHLIDTVQAALSKLGGADVLRISNVYDLSEKKQEAEPGYGFGASMLFINSRGENIPVEIQAGKIDGPTERFVDFDYGDFNIIQEYTVGNAIDPVLALINGEVQVLDQHSNEYDYYSQELLPETFCQQSPGVQTQRLSTNSLCIDLRDMRLAKI